VNCAVKFVPAAVGLKFMKIWQVFPKEPVAAKVRPVQKSLVTEKLDALVPVMALKPAIAAVEVEPFPIVTVKLAGKLIDAVTFAGFGVATSALLPVPLTGIENGLPDAPV
jgi:hypothetical protein